MADITASAKFEAAKDAAREALQGVDSVAQPDNSALIDALQQLYGDSYAAGGLAAAQELPATALSADLAGVYGTTDALAAWDLWQPGHPKAAAKLLEDKPALQGLLQRAESTAKDIWSSAVDQMGTALARGIINGDSVDTISDKLMGLVGDSSRAFTIANTEVARSVEAASQDQYADQGVMQWEWLLSPGACPDCEEAQADSPFDVGGGPEIPDHPNCRCSSSPIDPGTGGTGSPE